MLFRLIFIIFLLIIISIFTIKPVLAIENPFAYFNNKIGIHILFPEELSKAAELVNSSGGDWGYAVIPIQSGDKDINKWQQFMDRCKTTHIIPVIRLATEGDYFNTKVWRKPGENDIIDFANFLNSLKWPIKNRYVIVFNEVNRADEWGGSVDPQEYAKLLSYTSSIFKSKSPEFFILNAGLDNAAPQKPPEYENEYTYLQEMDNAVPGIFNQIDGFSSHSYPNPAFAQPPGTTSRTGTGSFIFERELVRNLSSKDLPVFITETGWSANEISDLKRADYYQNAFYNIWSDKGIVAVAPFLLSAAGSFNEFSFINEDGTFTLQYQMLKSIPKIRGMPPIVKTPPKLLLQQKKVLGINDIETNINKAEASSYRDFSKDTKRKKRFSLTNLCLGVLNWLVQ